MTLNEAIAHCDAVASAKQCECGAEHQHLSDWLRMLQQALDEIAQLRQELEQSSERFMRAQIVASQWRQRAELYEHQRNEWKALLGESHSPCHDCGGSGVVGVLPADGSAVIYKFCTRCGSTGKEPA